MIVTQFYFSPRDALLYKEKMNKIAKRLKEKPNYSDIVRRAIDHYYEYLGLNGAVKDFDIDRLEKEFPNTNIKKILKNLEEKNY